jgi:ribosomal protein S18 acetylase RimI-like enzyme
MALRRDVGNAAVAIRKARPADFADLIRLIRAYYRHDGIRFRRKLVPAALRRLLGAPALGRIWIAREWGHPIGYIAFSAHYDVEFGGLEGVITDLFVRREWRGRGVGGRLLATVEEHCRAAGIGNIELQVVARNRLAPGFYRKHGFRRLSRSIMTREL